MTGETVVYKNEMNLVPLRNFTSSEIDLFFSICNKLKEQDLRKIEIPFEDLKFLSNYYSRSIDRFVEDLERVYDKMLSLTYTKRSGRSFEKFVLFTGYKVDVPNQILTVSTNPELKHILNALTGDFTKFELQELTNLKSTYAKQMFRFLKQFKHTGYLKMTIDDFREKLDIPESYRMSDINKVVLKPIIQELSSTFIDLHVNKIKARKKNKIVALEFTFKSDSQTQTKKQASYVATKGHTAPKSKEITPQWLIERQHEKRRKKGDNPTIDSELEKEVNAFKEQLESYDK